MGVLALSGGGVVTARSGEGAGSYLGPRSSAELTALENLGLRMPCQDRGPGHPGAPLWISLPDCDVG